MGVVKKKCSIEGCNKPSRERTLCIKHYKRWRGHGDEGLLTEFHCSRCQVVISYRTYFATQLCSSCYGQSYYKDNLEKWDLSDLERQQKDEYSKEYYRLHKEDRLVKDKVYNAQPKNKTRRAKRYRIYRKDREQRDPQFKLQRILRVRLNNAVTNEAKSGSAVRDLGCTIDFLKTYIETLFLPGMTWENHGRGPNKWHIDHIVPLCQFNLRNRIELRKACYYTNLQPLWEPDNLKKARRDKLCSKSY